MPNPPHPVEFDGLLDLNGTNSYLVLANGAWYLMMLDIPPTGVFNRNGVLAASRHFAGLPNGTVIKMMGFVLQHDIDGTGNLQNVLHVERDLGR